MDVFAVILITLTILTICGICLFIVICAVQPRILHYLHKRRERTYYITALKQINEAEAELSIACSNPERKSSTSDHEKRTYLRILERSIRSGRCIEDEKARYDTRDDSPLSSFYYLRRFINQHLSPTTTITNTQRCTEL
ncbi:unnamed protein product [Adineta ricciae]|uniref:Uncharacterized protein n=1 Tax=Adineta ricciae TaxID=249248 RepID=A0A816D334_ADIRI|nr:unnamed protein product [Adineta ricciae]